MGSILTMFPYLKGKKIFNDDGSDADANVAVIIELKNHNALAGKVHYDIVTHILGVQKLQ